MAIVLKSNARLSDSVTPVGNLHGYSGPSDYRAMLDFTHQRYTLDGVDKSFADVAIFQRSTIGTYIDIFGRMKTAAANAPRFSLIPDYNEFGILLEPVVTNGLAGQSNGSAFSLGNSGDRVSVSWNGTGDVELSGTGISSIFNDDRGGSRNIKTYNRSGAASGTISISGAAKDIMVFNGSIHTSFMPYGVARAQDTLKLSPSMASLISSGSGTILCRYVYSPDDHRFDRGGSPLMIANSAAQNGGLSAVVTHKVIGLGQGQVNIHSDGAGLNVNTMVARNLGNRPPVGAVAGLYFSGFGAQAGIISHGQAGHGTSAVTPPTAFTDIYLGRPQNGAYSVPSNFNGILTHCVIYDRMVTDDEAFDMAVGWAA